MRRVVDLRATCAGAFIGLLAVLGCLAVQAAAAEKPPSSKESVERLLRQAYAHDRVGAVMLRQAALQQALAMDGDEPRVRAWLGYVRGGREWVRFDEPPAERRLELLAEYDRRRQQAQETVIDQWNLARWCASNGLAREEAAHLTKVLELDPDHSPARGRLGYKRLEGQWVNLKQQKAEQEQERQAARNLQRWQPVVRQIAAGLKRAEERERQSAQRRLQSIRDPAAVAALELELCSVNPEVAAAGIEALAQIKTPESSLALARQAVDNAWPEVRALAADQLKERNFNEFVPEILEALSSTIRSSTKLLQGPNGRILQQQFFSRETKSSRDTLAVATAVRFPDTTGEETPLQTAAAERVHTSALRHLAAENEAIARSLNRQNVDTLELNSRIGDALARISGEELPNSPSAWWSWWLRYNEYKTSSVKPQRTATNYRQKDCYIPKQLRYDYSGPVFPATFRVSGAPKRVKVVSTGAPQSNSDRSNPPMRRRGCCLVAGTLVQTEQGLRPVEHILAGDLVLSQNVTTGKLAYQPVVETTVGPPTDILTIYTGTDAIKATGGHAFWVLGKGWVRTRQLGPGMRLAGINGSVLIDEVVDEEEEAEAYNLVVDDGHTYFVGPILALSHDNTMCGATTTIAPGLTAVP